MFSLFSSLGCKLKFCPMSVPVGLLGFRTGCGMFEPFCTSNMNAFFRKKDQKQPVTVSLAGEKSVRTRAKPQSFYSGKEETLVVFPPPVGDRRLLLVVQLTE